MDDRRPERRRDALALLRGLEERSRGLRIGVTGAPGAGKSTLLDALIRSFRARGERVGPVPTRLDNFARAKLIVRTTLLHAMETRAIIAGAAPVEVVPSAREDVADSDRANAAG